MENKASIFYLLLCVCLAIFGGVFDHTALSKASEEIVTFAAILAAGSLSVVVILPGMFQPEKLSIDMLDRLRNFTDQQSGLWLKIFVSSMFLCATIIAGQIVEWDLTVSIKLKLNEIEFDFARLLSASGFFLLGLVFFQTLTFVRALKDIVSIKFQQASLSSVSTTVEDLSKDFDIDPNYRTPKSEI